MIIYMVRSKQPFLSQTVALGLVAKFLYLLLLQLNDISGLS